MTTGWHDCATRILRGAFVRAAMISTLVVLVIATSGLAVADDSAPDIRGTWKAFSEVHIEGEETPFVVEDTHEGVKLIVTDMEEHVFRGYFDFQFATEDGLEDKLLHFVGVFREDDEFVLGTKLNTVLFGEVDGDTMSIDYLAFGSTHSAGSYELRRISE
ncbi:MAG: hypothetical protein AAF563_03480 [Pseudomonadota bacterium]